jgi:hypothetical protein
MKISVLALALVALLSTPTLARETTDTALLLDATDPWTAGHIQALTQRAGELKVELRLGDAVSVFALRDDHRAAGSLWSRTCPRRGCDVNPLFEGADFAEEEFLPGFAAPFDSALLAVTATAHHSRISAIAQAVRQLACFSSFSHSSGRKRLIIFSDLIQNTPEFSLYRQHDLVKSDGRPLFADWKAELQGVDVEVFVLLRDRDAGVQGFLLIDQWRRLLLACHAHSVTFTEVGE